MTNLRSGLAQGTLAHFSGGATLGEQKSQLSYKFYCLDRDNPLISIL